MALRSILLLLLICMVGIIKSFAYDFSAVCETGQTLYYNIIDAENHFVAIVAPDGNSVLSGYYEPTGNIVLPKYVYDAGDNQYLVTSIGAGAFFACRGLTSVTIPNSVTTIGESAFYGCSGLISCLTIPNSVTTIREKAFYNCSGLISLFISNSVSLIEIFAFRGCNGLEQIVVESENTVYDSRDNCNALIKTCTNELIIGCKNTIIPNSATTIGESAFEGCSGFIGNLTIPNSVTTIGRSAFRYCSGIYGSLNIPNSVTTIGERAFEHCSGFMGSMTIPNSVTSIGSYAFYGCSGFTEVYYIGDITQWCNISFIDYYANPLFYAHNLYINNSLVTDLTIPSTVTEIKPYTFCRATCLTSLTILNSVTTIGESAFFACSGFGGSLTIPNSVTMIGRSAFRDCSGFTGNLTIPNSVTTIGERAFEGCSGFTGSLTIPNSVTLIGWNAFKGCSGFTGSLTISNSVILIDYNVFEGCSGFTGELTIPNSVTSISNYAFSGCSGFTGNLTIPNSVTAIGNCSFFGCNGLSGNLIIPNNVISIGDDAFARCSGFTGNLTIPNSMTTINRRVFYDCSGFTSLTLSNSVISIGEDAFWGCSGFTGVYYTGSIAQWCDITFPSLGSYGGNPLYFAHNLYINNSLVTDLSIPSTVSEVKPKAFTGATCLTSLTIPNSVTLIGESSFSSCSGLTGTINIPNSVESIGDGAFYGCSSFISLTIPNSVTSIGGFAFRGCSSLESITMLSSTPPALDDYSYSSTFYGTSNSLKIFVPYESLQTYKTDANWGFYQSQIYPWLQKSISGYGTSAGNWYFIASPVLSSISPINVDNMISETEYDLYRFNQSAELEWENYKNPVHTEGFTINNGKGYLYASEEDVNLMFKGVFNEFDERMVSLTYDTGKPLAGWNLVGNPFPVNAYANRSYYVMNENSTAIEPIAVSALTAIEPCTGILVKADGFGESVTFTKSTRLAEADGLLQITVAESTRSNTIEDKVIVSFNEGDALGKFVFNKDNAQISIPQGGENFAIVCAEKRGEMPLNFKVAKNGSYIISVNSEIVEMEYLHLIDNLTGTDVDLLVNPSYTFDAKTTDYASRFKLVFNTGSVFEDEVCDNEAFAFFNGSEWIISNEAEAILQVVNMKGQILNSESIQGHCSREIIQPAGVYLLRLIYGENVRTQKIVINK